MKRSPIQISAGILAITLILDTMDHGRHHSEYWWHNFIGFEFLLGLAGGVLLILFSKVFLYSLISRGEGYYGKPGDPT